MIHEVHMYLLPFMIKIIIDPNFKKSFSVAKLYRHVNNVAVFFFEKYL